MHASGGANCTSRRREMNNESICTTALYAILYWPVRARAVAVPSLRVGWRSESPAGLRRSSEMGATLRRKCQGGGDEQVKQRPVMPLTIS
jgi:hypothetical protein